MSGNRITYEAAMKKADSLAWDRKYKEAANEYRLALNEFADDIAARTSLAAALRKMGALTEALLEYNAAVKMAPDNVRLQLMLAETQQQAGQREASAQTYATLASLYQRNQNPEEAFKAWQTALQLDQNNIDAHTGLAGYYEAGQQTGKAVAELLIAGRLLALQAKTSDAVEAVERAQKLDPEKADTVELLQHIREGTVRQSVTQPSGKPDSQMQAASGARRIDLQTILSKNQAAHSAAANTSSINVAGIAVTNGTHAAPKPVEHSFRQPLPLGVALQNFSQSPEALLQAAQQAEAEQQPYIAIAYHEAILQNVPDNANSAFALGRLYRQIGQPERSIPHYRSASTSSRLMSSANAGLGLALYEAGKLDEAAVILKDVVDQIDMAGLKQEAIGQAWHLCRALSECYLALGQFNYAVTLSRVLLEYCSEQGWPEIAVEIRRWAVALNGYDEGAWWSELVEINANMRLRAIRAMLQSYELLEDGLWRGAEEVCLALIADCPDFMPIHVRQGEIYQRQHRDEAALAKYSNVIDVYAVRGETVQTIAMYQRVLALTPDNITMRTRLAKLLFDNNRVEESAHESLAVASSYIRIGQVERAMDEYRRLINLFPQNTEAYLAYGHALSRLGRGQEALQAYNEALALDPSNIMATVMVTISLAVQNEWVKIQPLFPQVSNAVRSDTALGQNILKEFSEAVDLYSDNPDLHYCLGAILADLNQYEAAIEHFKLARRDSNTERSVLSQRAIGRCYLELGQVDQAIAQLRNVAQRARGTGVLRMLAAAYAQNDELYESLNALLELKEVAPNDEKLRLHLAETYFKLGQLQQSLGEYEWLVDTYLGAQEYERAVATLQHMVEIAPSNLSVRTRLADTYVAQKQHDQALEVLGELADLQQRQNLPRDAANTYRTMIQIVRNLDSHRALALRQQIVRLLPKDIEARKDLVQAYLRIGNPTQALAEAAGFAKQLLAQNHLDDAIILLRMALQIDPWNISALEQLVYAQIESDKLDEARGTLQRLSGLAPNSLATAALRTRLENRRSNESIDQPT